MFYPALHFKNPFPSDMEGEKGGICECMEGETQKALIEMCVTL